MKVTTKGYIQVYRGGDFISRHRVETEAIESASRNGPGVYTFVYPDKEVEVQAETAPSTGYWPSDYWGTDGAGTFTENFSIDLKVIFDAKDAGSNA